jgi:protein phosphatase methylesterase 1
VRDLTRSCEHLLTSRPCLPRSSIVVYTIYERPRGAGQGNDQHGSTNSTHGTKDYSPLSAQGYFSQALAVNVTSTTGQNSGDNEEPSTSHFRVYYTPSSISRRRSNEDEDDDDTEAVVFVCHHGAGYSAMSFALFAKEIAELSNGTAGVLALDCRGHGELVTTYKRREALNS